MLLNEYINKNQFLELYKKQNPGVVTDHVTALIEQLPSFDIATLHTNRPFGKWLVYTGKGEKEYMCSFCSAKETNPKVAHYCYHCGAKMENFEE